MEGQKELYHEEIKKLKDFRSRLETHAIYKQDLDNFSDDYEELVAQAKVITRVSDRLQKKLDTANIQIREQNEEIKTKNIQLEETIEQLAKAKVGRKASTIMLTVALLLFVLEQLVLEPIIESTFSMANLDLVVLAGLFFIVKFLESGLEKYFVKQEQKKIMQRKERGEEIGALAVSANR